MSNVKEKNCPCTDELIVPIIGLIYDINNVFLDGSQVFGFPYSDGSAMLFVY